MLLPGQQECLKLLKQFYYNDSKQIFTLGGYAGVGKSYVISLFLQEMGISSSQYVTACFTGKASLNLIRNGVNSMTLHKLLYDIVIDKQTKKMEWVLKESLPNEENIKIIIVDEVGMVNEDLMNDLISFGFKIIAVGDPGQLTAIGKSNQLLNNPDYVLTEIVRQAESNPIIYLSMLAREGKPIEIGPYYDKVSNKMKAYVMDNDQRSADLLVKSSQIICGKNATRNAINNAIREEILGIDKPLPVKGDKLICTSNNWNVNLKSGTPLVNGLIGYAGDDIFDVDFMSDSFKLKFIEDLDFNPKNPDYNPKVMNNLDCSVSEFLFNSGHTPRPTDWKQTRTEVAKVNNLMNKSGLYTDSLIESTITDQNGVKVTTKGLNASDNRFSDLNSFDYAYAITTHKSQGSQFNSVYAIEEYLNPKTHANWLYTIITRAENKLILELAPKKKYYRGWRK